MGSTHIGKIREKVGKVGDLLVNGLMCFVIQLFKPHHNTWPIPGRFHLL